MAIWDINLNDRSPILQYTTQNQGDGWQSATEMKDNRTVSYRYTTDLGLSTVDFNITGWCAGNGRHLPSQTNLCFARMVATSIRFLRDSPDGSCSAVYTINSSAPIPACPRNGDDYYTVNNLSFGERHRISYTPLTLRQKGNVAPRFLGIQAATGIEQQEGLVWYRGSTPLQIVG